MIPEVRGPGGNRMHRTVRACGGVVLLAALSKLFVIG
jgi:hypothetical protein